VVGSLNRGLNVVLKKILGFFEEQIGPEKNTHGKKQLDLAAAVLLIEISEADSHFCDSEREALCQLLSREYALEQNEIDELIQMARAEQDQATDMYQFTRLIHEHFSYEEKLKLMENLWQVACADKNLDKYEEYSIRKIAELLYINHSDYIFTRNKIKKQRFAQ
jgi:uncharacterized tellurite resistance protein B-like protein